MPVSRAIAVAADKQYHENYFTKHQLFEGESWLLKHDEIVANVTERLPNHCVAVDIGCGPGRNAIPMAQIIKSKQGRLVCIDYLAIAIEKLKYYANLYGVGDVIETRIGDVCELILPENSYDLVVAWSIWENTLSKNEVINKINEMMTATRIGGFNLLMINSTLKRCNSQTGEKLPVDMKRANFDAEELTDLLLRKYRDWELIYLKNSPDEEIVHQKDIIEVWSAKQIAFGARRKK